MQPLIINRIIRIINIVDVIGISLILLVAFYFQFFLGELPCPLCLLQRLGLLAMGFGFLLNIRYRPRPVHYALSILAAFVTALVSMRQILLHIAPGDHGFGSAIFGLHMYTWVFILAVLAIIYIAIILSIPKQYHFELSANEPVKSKSKAIRIFTHIALILFLILAVLNIVFIIGECGFTECADNPIHYKLL